MPAEKRLFFRSCTATRAPSSSHTAPRTGTDRIQRLRPLRRGGAGVEQQRWEGRATWAEGSTAGGTLVSHARRRLMQALPTSPAASRLFPPPLPPASPLGAPEGRGGGVEERADALASNDFENVLRLVGGADDHAAACGSGRPECGMRGAQPWFLLDAPCKVLVVLLGPRCFEGLSGAGMACFLLNLRVGFGD